LANLSKHLQAAPKRNENDRLQEADKTAKLQEIHKGIFIRHSRSCHAT
jgi:hypothetical protein